MPQHHAERNDESPSPFPTRTTDNSIIEEGLQRTPPVWRVAEALPIASSSIGSSDANAAPQLACGGRCRSVPSPSPSGHDAGRFRGTGPVVTAAWSRSVVRLEDDYFLYESTHGTPPASGFGFLRQLELESRRRQVVHMVKSEIAVGGPAAEERGRNGVASPNRPAARVPRAAVQFFRQPTYRDSPSPSRVHSHSPSLAATHSNSLISHPVPTALALSSSSVGPVTELPQDTSASVVETPSLSGIVWGRPAEELLADPVFLLTSEENCQRLLLAEEEHTQRRKWWQSFLALRGDDSGQCPSAAERRTPSPSPPLVMPGQGPQGSPALTRCRTASPAPVRPQPPMSSFTENISAQQRPVEAEKEVHSPAWVQLLTAAAERPSQKTSKPIILHIAKNVALQRTPKKASPFSSATATASSSPHTGACSATPNAASSIKSPTARDHIRCGSPIPGARQTSLSSGSAARPLPSPRPLTERAVGEEGSSVRSDQMVHATETLLHQAFERPVQASPTHGAELMEFISFSEAQMPSRPHSSLPSSSRHAARQQYLFRLRQEARLLRSASFNSSVLSEATPLGVEGIEAEADTDDLLFGDNNYHQQNVQFILQLFGELWKPETKVSELRCVKDRPAPEDSDLGGGKVGQHRNAPLSSHAHYFTMQALGCIFENVCMCTT